MSDKRKRCGACKECGAIPYTPSPYQWTYPYQPYPNYIPSWRPGYWSGSSGGSISPNQNPTNLC